MNDVRNLLGRLQVQDFEYREFEAAPAPRRADPTMAPLTPHPAPEGLPQPARDPRKSSMADVFAVIANQASPQPRPAP